MHQREVGRRFAYWIKHTPGLPFDTVGTKNGSLLYQKCIHIHVIIATLRKEVFANVKKYT